MSTKPRLVFAGTPAFAAEHLQALINANFDIVGVYTQPDRPAKRGKKLTASPVKNVALANEIPIYQPLNFKFQEDIDALAALKPDILVVVAYGLILPQSVLDIPTIAPINVHASLLPRWRGAAPIERAIEAGDTETGVGIMVMEAGLDTGPVIAEARCDITDKDTGDSLRNKLSPLGCETLINAINHIVASGISATPQAELGVNYAHKLRRDEAAIDWQLDAQTIINKVRAFNSANVATFGISDKRVKLLNCELSQYPKGNHPAGSVIHSDKKSLHIACGDQCISLLTMQFPGGKALACRDIMNGNAALFSIGQQLS